MQVIYHAVIVVYKDRNEFGQSAMLVIVKGGSSEPAAKALVRTKYRGGRLSVVSVGVDRNVVSRKAMSFVNARGLNAGSDVIEA